MRITIGPGNEIANNDERHPDRRPIGVEPPNSAESLTNQNTVTQNSIHDNGVNGIAALGIDLAPFGAMNTAGERRRQRQRRDASRRCCRTRRRRTIDAATCAGCTVELFIVGSAGRLGRLRDHVPRDRDGELVGLRAVERARQRDGHPVTATATNSAGSTSEFSRNVNIPSSNPNNVPPVARFTSSCSGLVCSFDGSASSDSDGTVVGYAWDFGDGTTGSGATLNHTYTAGGTYTVVLTVTDNEGATGNVSHSVSPQSNGAAALDSVRADGRERLGECGCGWGVHVAGFGG